MQKLQKCLDFHRSPYIWNKNDKNIKADNVYNVANALNVSPAYLLGWNLDTNNKIELTALNSEDVTYKDVPLTSKELRAFCAMLEELRD